VKGERRRKEKRERERKKEGKEEHRGKREESEVPRYTLSFALSTVGVVYDVVYGRERERERKRQ